MTVHEAKRDARSRMDAHGIGYSQITARTVSFSDLARARVIFVTVHGLERAALKFNRLTPAISGIPRPSDGGYIFQYTPE